MLKLEEIGLCCFLMLLLDKLLFDGVNGLLEFFLDCIVLNFVYCFIKEYFVL